MWPLLWRQSWQTGGVWCTTFFILCSRDIEIPNGKGLDVICFTFSVNVSHDRVDHGANMMAFKKPLIWLYFFTWQTLPYSILTSEEGPPKGIPARHSDHSPLNVSHFTMRIVLGSYGLVDNSFFICDACVINGLLGISNWVKFGFNQQQEIVIVFLVTQAQRTKIGRWLKFVPE